jgi:hypothetical protein
MSGRQVPIALFQRLTHEFVARAPAGYRPSSSGMQSSSSSSGRQNMNQTPIDDYGGFLLSLLDEHVPSSSTITVSREEVARAVAGSVDVELNDEEEGGGLLPRETESKRSSDKESKKKNKTPVS